MPSLIMIYNKKSLIYIAVFLFPIFIATTRYGGGGSYALIFLFGLLFGWSEWQSLEAWEKKVLIGFLIFFMLVSLSLVSTHDFANGMKKVGRYIHFPLLIPMYLLLKKYRMETGKVFLLGLLAASFFMFGQAYYQTIVLGFYRAEGVYNSLIFGDVSMLIAVIVVCALLSVSRNWHHFLLGGVFIIFALSASIMSGAKGAWILLPVVLIWFLWIKRKELSTVSLLLMLMLGFLLVWSSLSFDRVKNRVEVAKSQYQIYSEDPSKISPIQERLEMWSDSITIWKANPLIGTGIGDFKNDRFQLFKDSVSHMKKQHNHAHNIYLDVLATAGLVGLFAMLILMQIIPFRIFHSFWIKEYDPWIKFYALSGMATIIAFAVFGLTEGWLARNAFVRTYLMFILVFMSSIAVAKMKKIEVISH